MGSEVQRIAVEDPEKLSLRRENLFTYFWVDPSIGNTENKMYLQFLRKALGAIEGLSRVEGLQKKLAKFDGSERVKVLTAASLQDEDYSLLQLDQRVESIVLFGRSEERARLLRSNFSKIVSYHFNVEGLKNYLLSEELSETRSSFNMLFMIAEDAPFLMQQRMNFHALCCTRLKQPAKADFVVFLRQLFPEQQQEIDRFQKEYRLEESAEETDKQALDWCCRSELYWQSLQLMPRVTANPKVLTYLRLQFKEVYEAIKNNYKRETGEVFAVVTLTRQQLEKLQLNVGNFVAFPSFVKAFSSEKSARAELQQTPNAFLVFIILPPLKEDNCIEAYDFGYCRTGHSEQKPNILFNIYNFFLVEEFDPKSREIHLSYGSLAQVLYKRQHRRLNCRLRGFEEDLMRGFDCWENLASGIDCQAAVLQMFGYFKDSLSVYEKLYQDASDSPAKEALTVELGYAYTMNEKYAQAKKKYQKIKRDSKYYLRALVYLADLHIRNKQQESLQTVIAEMKSALESQTVVNADPTEIFRVRNCIGMSLISRGEYEAAKELFTRLIDAAFEYYGFKYDGIALVHEININSAVCDVKLGDFGQAMQVLRCTDGWQSICGMRKVMSLTITERLQKYIEEMQAATSREEQIRVKNTVIIPLQLSSHIIVDMSSAAAYGHLDSQAQQQRKEQDTIPTYNESSIKLSGSFDRQAFHEP